MFFFPFMEDAIKQRKKEEKSNEITIYITLSYFFAEAKCLSCLKPSHTHTQPWYSMHILAKRPWWWLQQHFFHSHINCLSSSLHETDNLIFLFGFCSSNFNFKPTPGKSFGAWVPTMILHLFNFPQTETFFPSSHAKSETVHNTKKKRRFLCVLKVFNEISENSLFGLATPLYFIWDWMNNIIVDRQIFTFLHNFSGGELFLHRKK